MATLVIEYINTPCLSYSNNRYTPEWPPTPDRVFQALVATAYELEMDVQPLLEIEKIQPEITFPEACPINSAKVFVRSNQTTRQTPADLSRPYVKLKEGARLYYRYSNLPAEEADNLRALALNLTHIGRSQSQVIADVIDDSLAPTPDWEPHARGELMLNAPHEGRLKELDNTFNAGQRNQSAPMVSYRHTKNRYPSSNWRGLIVLKPSKSVHVSRTVQVAEAVRTAILSVCGNEAPVWVHGHGQDNHHIAITPLANVGNKYADGMMTGIGIWLPKHLSRRDRAEIAFMIAGIDKIQSQGLEFTVSVRQSDQVATKVDTWSRLSKRWISVTPVVLDRYPKKGRLSVERIIADSCPHSGLPEPATVKVLRYPWMQGIPASREFNPRSKGRLFSHVEMEFEEPVWGPVLVGRERFYGMGMFRPI